MTLTPVIEDHPSSTSTSPSTTPPQIESPYIGVDTSNADGDEWPDLLDVTFPQMISRQAILFADRDLVVDATSRSTYAQFVTGMTDVARALIALGIEPGDRVGVWAPNSIRWLLAALGGSAAGAAMMPMNSRFKGPESVDVVRRSRPRVLFTTRHFLKTDYPAMLRAAAGPGGLPGLTVVVMDGEGQDGDLSWVDFLALGVGVSVETAVARRESISAKDVSDIILTSGTTGHPKGVLTTHRQNMLGWMRYAKHFHLQTGERINATLPFFHNFGLKAGFLVSAMLGGTCICEDVFDPARLAGRIESERITYLKGTPALFAGLLTSPARHSADLSSLRLCLVAGSMIARELIEQMQQELCPHVVAGYGLSELTGGIALTPIGATPSQVVDWSGSLVEGVQVRIVDDLGSELPFGEAGEILARSQCVMAGYLDDPAATGAAVDGEGWLSTGDIGILDAQGFLRVTDRKKDMFIVGGFNAYPAEIERLMMMHPQIAQVAVIGMADAAMGEVGAAFVVAVPGAQLDAEQVIAWSRTTMSNFKVPRRVELVEHLPVNASMKVLKHELKAQLAGLIGDHGVTTRSAETAQFR